MKPTSSRWSLWRFVLLSGMVVLTGCWGQEADENILQFRVLHIAVDPDVAETVYVATEGGGIFKSTDGGSDWSLMNTGQLTDPNIHWLVFDPIPIAKITTAGWKRWIYVGTEDQGIFRSTDGGEFWLSISEGVTSPTVNSIVIDPNTCQSEPACTDIYAGTTGGGVFVNRNRGVGSWSTLNAGLVSTDIRSLAIFGGPGVLKPSLLLAGTENGEMYRIRPTDQTETAWTTLAKPVPSSEEDIYTIAITFPNIFFAGVTRNGILQSSDAGLSWVNIANRLPETDVRVIVVDPDDPKILYADSFGVSKSTDGGTTWDVVRNDGTGEGPSSLDIIRIAIDHQVVDPNDPTRKVLYASTYSRKLFKYSDIGDSSGWQWRELNLTP